MNLSRFANNPHGQFEEQDMQSNVIALFKQYMQLFAFPALMQELPIQSFLETEVNKTLDVLETVASQDPQDPQDSRLSCMCKRILRTALAGCSTHLKELEKCLAQQRDKRPSDMQLEELGRFHKLLALAAKRPGLADCSARDQYLERA